jgi:hypothetical protein
LSQASSRCAPSRPRIDEIVGHEANFLGVALDDAEVVRQGGRGDQRIRVPERPARANRSRTDANRRPRVEEPIAVQLKTLASNSRPSSPVSSAQQSRQAVHHVLHVARAHSEQVEVFGGPTKRWIERSGQHRAFVKRGEPTSDDAVRCRSSLALCAWQVLPRVQRSAARTTSGSHDCPCWRVCRHGSAALATSV